MEDELLSLRGIEAARVRAGVASKGSREWRLKSIVDESVVIRNGDTESSQAKHGPAGQFSV